MATPVTLVDAGGIKIDPNNPLAAGHAPLPPGAAAAADSSGNAANAVAAATLPAVAAQTNYLAGFAVSGAGATAGAAVTVTVTGVTGGPLSYTYVFATGAAVGNAPLVVDFDPPLRASAVNTEIVVSCPAGGAGNTHNAVSAHGYVI